MANPHSSTPRRQKYLYLYTEKGGKIMKRWVVIVSSVILVGVLAYVGVVLWSARPKDLGPDDLDRLGLDPGKGRIIGIVTDNEEYLPQGTTPQTYEGASVVANTASYVLLGILILSFITLGSTLG